jgi:hypothetical protein
MQEQVELRSDVTGPSLGLFIYSPLLYCLRLQLSKYNHNKRIRQRSNRRANPIFQDTLFIGEVPLSHCQVAFLPLHS